MAPMNASAALVSHQLPSPSAAAIVGALWVDECERDTPGVLIPQPVVQLVVRFGPSAHEGLDVHAMGARHTVHRKVIRRAQRTVAARLQLGVARAVLGASASAMAGRIVPLEALWGETSTKRLRQQLADAPDAHEAASTLERAIGERVTRWSGRDAGEQLAVTAAPRLARARVGVVAAELGVSERHLRRVFQETVGLSPKTYARIARFHHAIRMVRRDETVSWADVAAEAGYYDQAHLIAEFHAIAHVTPREFLGELRASGPRGG
jgi:AraC-like DNA-binding protein